VLGDAVTLIGGPLVACGARAEGPALTAPSLFWSRIVYS